MNLNILIVGVGGQGTLLASKILGEYARLIGKDCKVSEVHGMAQRGGSVVTYVRIGEKIHSPLIDHKTADMIIAFEELEALRWANYVKDGGIIVVNKQNRFIENYPTDI
jgi:indolepyruvate ferredoxin oxidoreductase beta subunit